MSLIKSQSAKYLVFVLLVTVTSMLIINQLNFNRSFYRFTVYLPGFIALLFLGFKKDKCFTFTEYTNQFKIRLSSVKWLVLALFFYTLLAYIATGISALFFDGRFIGIPKLNLPFSKVLLILILAFFEEIGWRGYALPLLLKKTSFTTASLVVGVIWAVWHFPGYLVNFGAPNDIPFILFCVWVIASSFIFTWLYIKSKGNIWTAVLLHFGANLALNMYPIMPTIANTAITFYLLTIFVICIAFYFKKTKNIFEQ